MFNEHPCILAVDDDPYILKLLRTELQQHGMQMLEARDGAAAPDVPWANVSPPVRPASAAASAPPAASFAAPRRISRRDVRHSARGACFSSDDFCLCGASIGCSSFSVRVPPPAAGQHVFPCALYSAGSGQW